jgi:hypothetical protein
MSAGRLSFAAKIPTEWRLEMREWRKRDQNDKREMFFEILASDLRVALLFARDAGVRPNAIENALPQVLKLDVSEMEKPLRVIVALVGLQRVIQLTESQKDLADPERRSLQYWMNVIKQQHEKNGHP